MSKEHSLEPRTPAIGTRERSPLRISHIWLYVKDIEASTRFYRDILGFKIVETFPDGSLLSAGQILLGIHREEGDRKSRPGGTSIILHTTDIKGAVRELTERGIKSPPQIEQEHFGWIASFRDPDGYLLELWQPT